MGDDVEVWSNSKRASGHLESLDVKHSKLARWCKGKVKQAKHFASILQASSSFCFVSLPFWLEVECSRHAERSAAGA